MGNALKGLSESKKFVFTALIIALVIAARKMGVELSTQELAAIAGMAGIATASQGIADIGKEKAKAEKAS